MTMRAFLKIMDNRTSNVIKITSKTISRGAAANSLSLMLVLSPAVSPALHCVEKL